ncbi:pyrroline-5-carboxylate reductase dimerization domain-containing protein [Spiroplasma litorale]|uniref:pyrroline-5-carboxylate reductase dimerization domain-containing protein n=1 Tax=Spiroplasma litorale TaxID=216942 RepID=UPI001F2BF952|nr:pyrroline-5-carboxylate reductase dimerization domain-containing protein [Spiroplasma litorale]
MIDKVKKHFDENINIIRIMPNMNAKIYKSTTAYSIYGFNNELIKIGLNLLRCFGYIYEIYEEKFSSFVALTGSAPAFIYEFIKGFKDFALENDYDENISNDLIKETIIA